MARRSVGVGMLETTSTATVHSLPESPPEGDEMEKGLLMQAFYMVWGLITGLLIAKADWRGLWK